MHILLLLPLRMKSLRGAFLSEEAKDLKVKAGILLGWWEVGGER